MRIRASLVPLFLPVIALTSGCTSAILDFLPPDPSDASATQPDAAPPAADQAPPPAPDVAPPPAPDAAPPPPPDAGAPDKAPPPPVDAGPAPTPPDAAPPPPPDAAPPPPPVDAAPPPPPADAPVVLPPPMMDAAPAPMMADAGALEEICRSVDEEFRKALLDARWCVPDAPNQCGKKVMLGLGCPGCGTYVNSTVQLDQIRARWNELGCQSLVKFCPPVACFDVVGGLCVQVNPGSGGICRDLTFAPVPRFLPR
jgi:hypothetical protein